MYAYMEFYIAKLAKQSFWGQIDKMSLTASLKVDISCKNIVMYLTIYPYCTVQ